MTITATKTFTVAALDAELGRRRNNKKRDVKAKAKSYVLPALTKVDIDSIKEGEIVRVEFKSNRVEYVGLKASV